MISCTLTALSRRRPATFLLPHLPLLLLMMMMMIAYVRLSSSLSCYRCPESQDYCRDPFTKFDADVPDCEGHSCFKTSHDADVGNGTSYSVVERGCTEYRNATGCTKQTIDGVPKVVCTCGTDYCNSSHGSRPNLLVAVLCSLCFLISVHLT